MLHGQPLPPEGRPQVVTYYRVYAVLMAVMYFVCVAAGVLMIVVGDQIPHRSNDLPAAVQGVIYTVVGAPLCAAFIVAATGGRARWRYIYGFVMIAIGLMSCCCMPASIPLLIFWLKPEVKAWFGGNA
jgi:hypothetical protein